MSDIVKVTDHWLETVSDFILEQYRGAENWKSILKAVIDKYTEIEDNVWKLASILDFKTRVKEELPSGALLDFIAGIVNIKRNIGESDAAFYERFIIELGRNNAGTPDGVIYTAAQLSGDPHPQYMDEAPATFFVYDGPRPKKGDSPEPVYEYKLLQNFVDGKSVGTPTQTDIPSHADWVSTVQDEQSYEDMLISDYSENLADTSVGASLVDTRSPVDFTGLGVVGGTPYGITSSDLGDYENISYGLSFGLNGVTSSAFTLEFWSFCRDEYGFYGTIGTETLLCLGEPCVTPGVWDDSFYLSLDINTYDGGPGHHPRLELTLQKGWYNGDSGNVALIGEEELTGSDTISISSWLTSWHHFAITSDGTNLRLFIDGRLMATKSLSSVIQYEGYATADSWSTTLGSALDSMLTKLHVKMVNYNQAMPDAAFAQLAVCGQCKWTSAFTPPTEAYTVANAEWEQGGHQLSRSQVRKLAPAGVLGLPGAALLDAEGNYIVGADGKLILLVADDSNIEREVLLADNLGNIVITPQSVPVRVKLTGPTVPTIPVIETEWNGLPVDAVRIKDLPDAQYDSAYMVRDNDTAGTTKINESEVGIQMKPSGTNTLKFYRRGPTAESDTEG